jgi:hypothetical protein
MTQEVKPVLVISTPETTIIVTLPTEKPEDIYAEMDKGGKDGN